MSEGYRLAEPQPGSVRRDLAALFVESESIEDGVMRIPTNRTATLILAFFLAAYLALVPAGAQQSDLQAIYKRFQEYYQAGNYAAAVVEAQKLEAVVKGRFGTSHTNYAAALNRLALVYWRQGKYSEAEGLYKRALAIREKALGASHPDVGQTLHNLGLVYRDQGKYTEAAGLFERALVIRETALGANHLDVAHTLHNLGLVYWRQGKYSEAEGLYKRALAVRETALGANHLDVAHTLHNLALVYWKQGKYSEAEGLYKRALAVREKALGANHPDVGRTFNNLALVYRDQGKYAEAEELLKRALVIREQALGASHPDVGQTLTNLANVFRGQGKYGEAEGLLERALSITENAKGANHPDVAWTLTNLANVFRDQGKYGEAEGLYKRALAITEKANGANHRTVAWTLKNLAYLYWRQGRYGDAEALHKRALAITEQVLGESHPDVADALNNLALVYWTQGKYSEAEGLSKRALAILEKALGANHRDVGWTLNDLGLVYRDQGKYVEAEALFKRALTIREKALGASHAQVGKTLNNLAIVYRRQGKDGEAEGLYKRALAIQEKAFGANHPDVAWTLNNMAILYEARGESGSALAYSRKATAAILVHRTAESTGTPHTWAEGGLVERRASYFQRHVANLAAAARKGIEPAPSLANEAIEIAQWASQSSAAAAVQQIGTRLASGGGTLATLVRQNQDLAALWRDKDEALITALSEGKNQAGIDVLRKEIADIESRLTAVAARLDTEFPEYAALARPNPLKVEEAQRLVGPDEAVVFFLMSERESYVFAVTGEGFWWKTIAVPEKALADKIAALRWSIGDPTSVQRGFARLDECGTVDARGLARVDCRTLGFDFSLAHEIYDTLFGKIAADIKDKKHLIVVPSGALTSLPFQVLITEKPEGTQRLSDAAWLIKRHAITVLPSVASLRALRAFANRTRTGKPFIGFGNPVFQKAPTDPTNRGGKDQRVASNETVRGMSEYFRGALGDVSALRHLAPLYDTADELKGIAASLGAPANELILGANASETAVKSLSGSGRLAEYRVVAFATHGLVAGDIKGLAEPALALTVPDEPTEADDGLLTASEVATLKLNADWVILSACNTAAGDKPGAEALSGLARAFFYAGGRGLLVSHWPVKSSAAVKLTTTAIAELKAHPEIGRAEALRRAMLALMQDKSEPSNAHPAIWAPFMVVGEGGSDAKR